MSTLPVNVRKVQADSMADDAAGSLDVSWLLHSKKERIPPAKTITVPDASSAPVETDTSVPPSGTAATNEKPSASLPSSQQINGATAGPLNPSEGAPKKPVPAATAAAKSELGNGSKTQTNDENKPPVSAATKGPVSNAKYQGRRGSWISNLSSKFSSTPSPTASRSGSLDAQAPTSPGPKSPQVEFANPFDKKQTTKAGKGEKPKDAPIVITHTPRRQSVLVSAGQERKLDQPGFLSSAFRRLSSSNNATLGKGAGSGAIGQRRVMNVDPNRERIKITDFDQNKMKRVAFCVDVEIAGYGAQADEEHAHPTDNSSTGATGQAALATSQAQEEKKDASKAKYKDMAEGAALKKPQAAEPEQEQMSAANTTAADKAQENGLPAAIPTIATEPAPSEPQPIPTTRKKEKKKRSEAERKERRDKKRRQAEANGLVPMELSGIHDDDSDSTLNPTPPGATTPRNGDSPTTDPLRIYKRCCQLRETTVLDRIKDQISKPSASLAEAPGTAAVIDISGTSMTLDDITTFGDWLAVVPVRKLVLDDCELTDESLRIVLAGLSSCKSTEQAKQNRKLPKRAGTGVPGREQMGVIEKLSLKNNTKITNLGWKHIALFLHISRSLKAIDLSGIPFPRRSQDYMGAQTLSRTSTASSTSTLTPTTPEVKYGDLGSLFAKALTQRLGDKLEEMIFSRCGLAASNIGEIVDCCIKRKIRRLGLAENSLSPDGLEHVVRYVKSGACEGLDLGGNSLHDAGHMVAAAVDEDNPLFAISLADCNLTPEDLSLILAPLAKLKNFKFIDLSRNHKLFGGEVNAVPVLRKLLPRLKSLKRIHLADVELTSEHVIALAEMLPDCPELAHVSILDNAGLVRAMNSTEGGAQEEACAFLASLMTAVRVSRTIIAIELEVPSSDSSEVVKALASQIVAYSLRNMEYGALDDAGVEGAHTVPGRDAPDVLLHIVGHMEGYSENHDNDEPAPDEDYMIASTGIVKALGICLGTKDSHSRSHSRNPTPTASGTATPRQGAVRLDAHKKPKNVSLQLCDSARKIRMRLRPAMVKEDRAGNDAQYRRLMFLDQTLERMIQRFEDEYPESKVPALPSSPPTANGIGSLGSSFADTSVLSASTDSNGLSKVLSAEEYLEEHDDPNRATREPYALKLSRTSSNTSLAAKALTSEEGRMHRLGQTFRREVLKPTQMDDELHGTSTDDPPEDEALAALRSKLESLRGEDLRQKVLQDGVDKVISDFKLNINELRALQHDDPAAFEAFKESQMAAQINQQL